MIRNGQRKGEVVLRELLNMQDRLFDIFIENGTTGNLLSLEDVNEFKLAFHEVVQVYTELFNEKGGDLSVSDVEAKIPNNIWLRVLTNTFSKR